MEGPKVKKHRDEFAWRQFCRLGEMIGDGLHHEEPWILKEYKHLERILLPEADAKEREFNRRIRKAENKKIDEAVSKKLQEDRCKCGGKMKQTRSGAKTVKCIECGTKYRYKRKN